MRVWSRVWGVVLVLPVAVAAQQSSSHANETLSVTGETGQAAVIRRNGKSYVDVEALARITNSTLGFQGNRMILTLPAPPPPVVPSAPAQPPAAPKEEKGFTRDFLRSGIETMSVVREWRSAIENAVRTNSPVEESWVSGYRHSANDRMALAVASVVSESDKQGVGLLQNELANMQQLSDRFLDLRKSLTFVPTDALDNDPLDQKILACAQAMASAALPGAMFEDIPSCH